MPVYVDPLCPAPRNRNWRWRYSCHMTADTPEELNRMAQRLGLSCTWLHATSALPHYDLTESKRRRAVELGAVEITRQEFVRWIRAARPPRHRA